ncbi:hypothetical protein Lfu02_17350 [Longispora fulva]|uniref:Uncharacterized protein n=1 Tax=Longispora fulva TaxID=619741 RepID=A0A8J7GNB5_9ACTN|nr:hypothetical protein [Longispora fulva]MBG6140257.1 hypothetical protein [Longispora fulva]GIG57363.1 hypothetical protein Lfu02_17350 [Longispora fulva]
MVRANFQRKGVPPNEWAIPPRSPTEPPQGYDWRKAVQPGPLNAAYYQPRKDEVVYISEWAGRDVYEFYEDARASGSGVSYRRSRPFDDPARFAVAPYLFMVTGFEPYEESDFAWLAGWRCTPSLRVPDGDGLRIWVRMTEVIPVEEAQGLGLLAAPEVGDGR